MTSSHRTQQLRWLFGAGLALACAHAEDPLTSDQPAPVHAAGSHAGGGKAGGAGNATSAGKGSVISTAGGGGAPAKPDRGGAGGNDMSEAAGNAAEAGAESAAAGSGEVAVPTELAVQHKTANSDPNDNQIRMGLKIVSTATSATSLSSLELRYYFTSEVALPLTIELYDAAINGAAGYRTVSKDAVKTAVTAADGYLEVTFSAAAGDLASGDALTLDLVVHGPDWTGNFAETDDYSFAADHAEFVAWQRVTLFGGTNLIWGVEP